jgi:hypothetical protein
MLKGVDTSIVFQGKDLTTAMIAAEGVEFHIAQLTQGAYWRRRGTKKRLDEARQAGHVPGAYHFLTRVVDPATDRDVSWNSGKAQCDFFISELPRVGGSPTPAGLLIALDVEAAPPTAVERGQQTFLQEVSGPTWKIVRDFVKRWIASFPGHPLLIYSSRHEWSRIGKDVQALDDAIYCWNAAWVRSGHGRRLGRQWNADAFEEFEANASLPDPWKPGWGGFERATIWQCTGLGIEGYGKIDGNLFEGDKAELAALATSAAQQGAARRRRVRIPPNERVTYRRGYNRFIRAAGASAQDVSIQGPGQVFDEGVAAARTAVLSGLPEPLLAARTELTPVPIGRVRTLVGQHLRARIHLAEDAKSVPRYEIELADGDEPTDQDWLNPRWSVTGGPLVSKPQPNKKRVKFEAIGSRAAKNGAIIASRRPTIHLSVEAPIRRLEWRLLQDGVRVDGKVLDKITRAERTFAIRPRHRLRGVGEIPEGYLFPPFDVGKTYVSSTYAKGYLIDGKPSRGHSAYAVDFNRTGDLGDTVRAVARGVVYDVDENRGLVEILHGGGFISHYGHMRKIPARIRKFPNLSGASRRQALAQAKIIVGRGVKVGEISNVGTGAVHLHHQHRKLRGKTPWPSPMHFMGVRHNASHAGPEPNDRDDWVSHTTVFQSQGDKTTGMDPDAQASFQIRVRWVKGDWSRWFSRRFTVQRTKADPALANQPDDGDGPDAGSAPLRIDHPYNDAKIPAGRYTIRYRCEDDTGDTTSWAYDHTVTI